ncbi:MAG: hypothetical protein ACFFCS_16230, partial [Candidatus Hodarchaeota archaeon]
MNEIPINEIYGYLDDVIAGKFKKERKVGKKFLQSIMQDFLSAKGSIDDLGSKLDPEKDDLVTRSVNRFTTTLQAEMENFNMNLEEEIDYKKLKEIFDFLTKFFRVYNENGKKWFPKFGKDFKEELKSLDLFMRKLFRNNGKLDNFIKTRYDAAKNAEEISEKLKRLEDLSDKVSEGKEKIASLKDHAVESTEEIKSLEDELVQLENDELIVEERKYFREQNKIKQQIQLELSKIKKSLKKFQKAVENGHYTPRFITSREIKDYVKSPFKGLMADGPEYPKLRAILENLAGSLEVDDIQLRDDKKEKTMETVNSIKEDYSLKPLITQYNELKNKRKDLKKIIEEKG